MVLRVLSVLGTRPEAIKLAPVIKRLDAAPGIHSSVCATAQHRQMLDQVLDLFEIAPDHDLDLMQPGQDLYDLTARVLTEMKPVLQAAKPDILLVQGDTTTCLAAALAAFYGGVPIGHVEAGLRTGDMAAPFPEEGNRVLVSRLADLHFAPTAASRDNLLREGTAAERIFVTGNTVIDALLSVRDKAAKTGGAGALEPDMCGDWLAVGSETEGQDPPWAGAVYLYTKKGDQWELHSKLKAPDAGDYDRFGADIALQESSLLVGAYWRGPGQVYLYQLDGSQQAWKPTTKLLGSDTTFDAYFGSRLAMTDNSIVITASLFGSPNGYQSGAAYAFELDIFTDGFESGDTSAWSNAAP